MFQLAKADILKWMWVDVFVPYFKQFVFHLFFNGLAIGSQIAAFALLYQYVNKIEQAERISFLNYSFDSRDSFPLLIGVALCTGVLLLVSGLLSYHAKRFALKIARQYEEFCSIRIFHTLRKYNPDSITNSPQENNPSPFDIKKIKRTLIKDTRFCGKMVNLVASSTFILLKLLVSFSFMCYVHIPISLLVLTITVPMVMVIRSQGKKVVRFTQARENRLSGFISQKNKMMNDAINTNVDTEELEFHYKKGKIHSYYNKYYGMFEKMAYNEMIMIVLIAILSVVTVIMGGYLFIFGDMPWAIFVAYMIALRFFFTSLRGMNGVIKKASRSYGYVKHYKNTLQLLESEKPIFVAGYNKNQSLNLDEAEDGDDDDE